VCLARPSEPLKPNTRYAWHTNVAVPDGYAPEFFEGLSREFTTGSALDSQPIAASAVSLVVTEDHHPTNSGNDCGIDHWMDVAYSLHASEPGVLHFADYTPSYVMHATLLAGGSGATATLYMPPACLAPVIYDAAGHRTALPEWCPGDAASPPTVPWETSDDDAPGPPSSSAPPNPPAASPPVAAQRERHPLCTLSMPPSPASRAFPAAAGLGLALLLAERRRRRS
jgi:hypothetical protein